MLIQRSFCDPFWQAWIEGKKVLLLFYTYFPFWNFFWVVVGCLPWPWGLNFGFPTYSFDHEKAFDKWCRLLNWHINEGLINHLCIFIGRICWRTPQELWIPPCMLKNKWQSVEIERGKKKKEKIKVDFDLISCFM